MSRRFLVTGAGGFIGRRLMARLQAGGHEAFGWTRGHGDLADREGVAIRLADLRPSHIIHLAAVMRPAVPDGFQVVAAECRMLTNLLSAMPQECRLIYAGSMAEYGYSGTFAEEAPCFPRTAYGMAKHAGTGLALAARVIHGRDVRVARLFGVYGPGEAASRLLPHVASRLARGLPVPLSDGLQRRDFIHVDDVCTALLAMAEAEHLPLPLINIGTGQGVSVRAVCETIAEVLGADPALLDFGALPRRAVDEDCLIADPARLRQVVAISPQRWASVAAIRADVMAVRDEVLAADDRADGSSS